MPLKRLTLVHAFSPQLRGHHSSVAPNPNSLVRLVLVLVVDLVGTRHIKQIGLVVDLTGPRHDNKIICQYLSHCRRVVFLNGGLVFCVNRCNSHSIGLGVCVRRTTYQRQQRANQNLCDSTLVYLHGYMLRRVLVVIAARRNQRWRGSAFHDSPRLFPLMSLRICHSAPNHALIIQKNVAASSCASDPSRCGSWTTCIMSP